MHSQANQQPLRQPLDASACADRNGIFRSGGCVGLTNGHVAAAFDANNGELAHIIDVASGQEFVAPSQRRSLLTVVLTRPGADERLEIHSSDFDRVVIRVLGESSLTVLFEGHPTHQLRAAVDARIDKDRIRLRAEVTNDSDWCVAGVIFPQTAFPPSLGADDSRDRLLIPWSGGGLVHSPARFTASEQLDYPYWAFAQFYAFYNDRAGLYIAAEDNGGHHKTFRIQCETGRYASLNLQHNQPELPGNDFELPYDVVLRTFTGNWRHAADLYKTWAEKQSWCRRALTERKDLPPFLKEGAALLIGSIHNPRRREETFGLDMEKLPGLLDRYRQATGVPHMIFVPYGWEHHGDWSGINYFPAVPSDETWKRINGELKWRGHRTAFMVSGFWWVIKRKAIRDLPPFDDSEDFRRRRDMCVHRPDGTVWTMDVYNYENMKTFYLWKGLSTTLCHGSPEARRTMKDIFLRIADLGVSLINFDQEIGGGQQVPCYHPEHPHAPGRGNYMWEGFRDVCDAILEEAKPDHPDLGLFMENESELAIQRMATHWSRQFGEVEIGFCGSRGVGLFSYLYHEYTTCIGAAMGQGQGFMRADKDPELKDYVLTNNVARGLIPGPFMRNVPLDSDDPVRRRHSRLFCACSRVFGSFPDYLILGRTLHPLGVECDTFTAWFFRNDPAVLKPVSETEPAPVRCEVELPVINSGRFEAPDGSQALFLIPVRDKQHAAAVTLPAGPETVVCDASRAELQRIPEAREPRRVTLTLEPYEINVILMK